jgi:shikimate kinase
MAVRSTQIPPTRILLVGMMGAGKSTVGHELAKLTGWRYLDNDELLERAVGESARKVLDTRGAASLRRAESAALAEGLREEPPVIASVAGGVVEDRADRDRIRNGGFVVWLRAPIEVLVARVGTGTDRPWLQPDPGAAMRMLYSQREPLYAEVASIVVDVEERTPAETAGVVLDQLASAVPFDRGGSTDR